MHKYSYNWGIGFFYSCYTVIEFVSCCFSVGIEDAGDLVADLTQALEKVK